MRISSRGLRRQVTQTWAFSLDRGQGCSNDLIAIGKSDLASRDFADLARETVIDFIADDQESEQRAIRFRAKVNWLHKSLVQVMVVEPPMAGLVFVQGFL